MKKTIFKPGARKEIESILVPFCQKLGVKVDEVVSDSKKRKFVEARIIISYYLSNLDYKVLEIANILRKDHSSIVFYKKRYLELSKIYPDFKLKINQ